MNYTNNYHLPQWEKSDKIKMADFNAAMGSIETGLTAAQSTADAAQTAVSELPYAVGVYTGNEQTIEITLGFRPRFVILSAMYFDKEPETQQIFYFGITGGHALWVSVEFTDTGFNVKHLPTNSTPYTPKLNAKNYIYDYIAFK